MKFPRIKVSEIKLNRIRLKPSKKFQKRVHNWLRFSPIALALAGSAILIMLAWPAPAVNLVGAASMPADLRKEFSATVQGVHALEKRQNDLHNQVVSNHDLEEQLAAVQLDADVHDLAAARNDLATLNKALQNWNYELSGHGFGGGTHNVSAGTYLPILLYHYPPPNFEQQLTHLEQAGYTTIDLDQAEAGLHGGPLPTKPVVITFDDGFAVQMSAYNALVRHHMKATFYIIDAGAASRWCIGAGRRYHDPLQPATGCGDSYLSWGQVRMIDRSGLITIGGHTINHRNLATLPVAEQRLEIITGKQQLEAQLGHTVRHFAYPYGAFNADSIQIVKEAGYVTAVTTEAGVIQPEGSDFTLRRIRDAMVLN